MSYILFCDGGSRGNPGPSAAGWVIFEVKSISSPKNRDEASAIANSVTSQPILSSSKFLGNTTNNVAEWSGLIHGLEDILKINSNPVEILVLLDSELVCKQVKGIYKVKQPHLILLSQQVKALVKNLTRFEIAHIFREDNKLADAMVNQCLDSL
jgi:ribonuclease HI